MKQAECTMAIVFNDSPSLAPINGYTRVSAAPYLELPPKNQYPSLSK